jgi:hypothetical protein
MPATKRRFARRKRKSRDRVSARSRRVSLETRPADSSGRNLVLIREREGEI